MVNVMAFSCTSYQFEILFAKAIDGRDVPCFDL